MFNSKLNKTMNEMEDALTEEMEKVVPMKKPDVQQAQQRAMTAQNVIDKTLENHRHSIQTNETVVKQYLAKIDSHKAAIETLEGEIENLERFNDAMVAMIAQLEEPDTTLPPEVIEEKPQEKEDQNG